MNDKITKRIQSELGLADFDERCDRLSGADLHSLLLALIKRRIVRTTPVDLLSAQATTASCSIDARLLNKMECLGACAINQMQQ